ncbi:class I SAM-dependent methyltransferase [Acaryochloris sp. IP29b_bin.148]|uniref:class I SAM-dependent methyltransferase n=1 Tax=Acaryochloris sp. IP29b_bin.148 TaxID=2969218 RepID=UPI00262E207C|nr:class I SAM-dependent methyltransferase [Acaryochloris sp. IP29b_bin.148]
MTAASPQAPRLSSRVVNGLLAIKPLANFAKFQARKMMIERAESIGVPWRKRASSLMDRGLDVWEAERQAIQTPDLDYPDYYMVSFHAYESGNLSWEAATEVEVASYAAHARIWPESGAKGDGRLRQSYHQVMQEKISTAPKDILDMGCSVGLSTLALQETYPEARLTGLDLSPYFLAIANHNTPANDSLQWIHRAAEETGLPDNSFDLVSICLVCHELPRTAIRNIFAEAHRLLRPQGHLAVMDMNPNSDVHRKLPPYVLTLLKSTEPYLDDYFTFDIQQAFVEAGFQQPSLTCNSPRHRTLIAQVL